LLTHNISLCTDSNKTIDVFADGNKNLASHVSTFLGTRSLVLDMNTGSTLLDKHLCELHHGSQSTVSSISVSYDGSQKVCGWEIGTLGLWRSKTLFALLSVMEELGIPEMLHLVWDSCLHVLEIKPDVKTGHILTMG
jgi:hypothetical protein